MIIHLIQFRFGATDKFYVRPPPYLVNLNVEDWMHLRLFWTPDTTVTPVPVRDIYKLEFDLFTQGQEAWVIYYLFSVAVFLTHGLLGWAKLVPSSAFHIPKLQQQKVINLGNAIIVFVAL